MKTLLRIAPWVDASLLRENLIKSCEAVFTKWGDDAPDRYQKHFDMFLKGERAVLPDSYDLRVAYLRVFRHTCGNYMNDQRWAEAKSEFERYFFTGSYWVRDGS
jgi:hypothetical protein